MMVALAGSGSLTRNEVRVLWTVRHGMRDARFDHPTLNGLQTQRLVESVTVKKRDGGLSLNRRWSITEAGIAALQEHR